MIKKVLQVNNLCVSINNIISSKDIIKNLNLCIDAGQVHVIMGPNGSGKSSLAYSIMGGPNYYIKSGQIKFLDKNIITLSPDSRARLGIFLAFQDPCEIEGATVFSILKQLYMAKSSKLVTISKFSEFLFEKMDILKISHDFACRDLNVGFSGGEKKKFEILQMLILQPKLVILDEIDSGLDVDSLQIVAAGIVAAKKDNPEIGVLIITHYQRILKYINPDFVHIMQNGEIKKSGDFSLAQDIELRGYGEYDEKKNA